MYICYLIFYISGRETQISAREIQVSGREIQVSSAEIKKLAHGGNICKADRKQK